VYFNLLGQLSKVLGSWYDLQWYPFYHVHMEWKWKNGCRLKGKIYPKVIQRNFINH